MDNTEQSLKILGKFLAVANITKVYKNAYQDKMPDYYFETLVEELIKILEPERCGSLMKKENRLYIGITGGKGSSSRKVTSSVLTVAPARF